MKRLYSFGLITALTLCTLVLHAQQVKDSSATAGLRSYLKIKGDIIGAYYGLEWEQKMNRNAVIDLFGGVAWRYQSDDGWILHNTAALIIEPEIYAEYKNYYNLMRRIAKKKKIKDNSANFFFGRVETVFAVKNQNYFNLLFSQGWGVQRKVWKKLNVDCHLGIFEHIFYDKPPTGGYNYIKIEPLAEFSFCYIF